jgi:hypothetical protein
MFSCFAFKNGWIFGIAVYTFAECLVIRVLMIFWNEAF